MLTITYQRLTHSISAACGTSKYHEPLNFLTAMVAQSDYPGDDISYIRGGSVHTPSTTETLSNPPSAGLRLSVAGPLPKSHPLVLEVEAAMMLPFLLEHRGKG
jgi:hypothetical protein